MKGIMTLLSKYKAKELPSATELGLPQIDWLEIYYDKMGTERGKPLTYKERSWNIPGESDPSGWSDEVWAEWRD